MSFLSGRFLGVFLSRQRRSDSVCESLFNILHGGGGTVDSTPGERFSTLPSRFDEITYLVEKVSGFALRGSA